MRHCAKQQECASQFLSKFCKSSRTMPLTISFNLPMNRSVFRLLLSMLFQNIGDEKHAIHGENVLSSVKKEKETPNGSLAD